MTRHTQLTKASVLTRLVSGETVKGIFKSAGYSDTSLFYAWKKKDVAFATKYAAIKSGEEINLEEYSELDALKRDGTPWQVLFIKHYKRYRNRVEAAKFAGKPASYVLKCLDPDSDKFDVELSNMMTEVKLEEALQVEDILTDRAINHQEKFAIDKLLPTLPLGIGEKFSKKPDPTGNITNVLALTFHDDNRDRALTVINDMLGQSKQEQVDTPRPKATWLS